MKITMYGAPICPDCVAAKEVLSQCNDIELIYHDITATTNDLKQFLEYRDSAPIFSEVKANGKIGIPLFILEDGTLTFDIDAYKTVATPNSCSIDGHC